MVYLFLADGFEIIEAMAPVDMLRRADIDVKTVGVTGKSVSSSCGINVEADITIEEFSYNDVEAIILPGGMTGTVNLENNKIVQSAIDRAAESNTLICAICAAPSILAKKGLLKNVEATAFPSFVKYLEDAVISDKFVIRDGNIITARGAGVSVDFGLEIVSALSGADEAARIREQIQCQ